MRVIIAGSRHLTDYAALSDAMETAALLVGIEPTVILSGRERSGVDALGERWAAEHGLPVETYPANWLKFPRQAGAMRNVQMSRRADALVALMLPGGTPGTQHMIKLMAKKPSWIAEVT